MPLKSLSLYSSILIEGNVKINPRDKRGYTPLHLVARTTNEKAMLQLIEAGADVNERCHEKFCVSPV